MSYSLLRPAHQLRQIRFDISDAIAQIRSWDRFPEAARAESADEGLGGILSQGLLATLVSYQQALFPL